MSGLMRLAHRHGAKVTGSDRRNSDTLRALQNEGFEVYVGHCPQLAEAADLVVYTAAVPADDPERRAARASMERSEWLGHVSRLYRTVVAVAGTHGKTTVCGMLTAILHHAGASFSAHVGGDVPYTDHGTYLGGDELFLTEACEYQRHFLHLTPTIGIITNVEHDHPDCYPDADSVYRAFGLFALRCGTVLTCDPRVACMTAHTHTCTYTDICIQRDPMHEGRYALRHMGREIDFSLRVWGDFNAFNAAYAASCAMHLGVSDDAIREGLSHYTGAARRQQQLGTYRGMPVLSDYAHHPTEIRAVCREAAARYGKICVVFEPHTYSRTRALLTQFADCFVGEILYLLPTYAAREADDPAVDGMLAAAIRNVPAHTTTWPALRGILQKTPHKKYGAIIFVGAGTVHNDALELVALER